MTQLPLFVEPRPTVYVTPPAYVYTHEGPRLVWLDLTRPNPEKVQVAIEPIEGTL